MKIEEFKALTRDEMIQFLRQEHPELAKGRSREKKDQLIELYRAHIDTQKTEEIAKTEETEVKGTADGTLLDVDYSALEVRVAASLGVSPDAVHIAEKPKTDEINTEPDLIGRRDEVMRELSRLNDQQLRTLSHIKQLMSGRANRQQRRVREALSRKASRFLPAGVTLMEAVSMV